MKRYKLLQCCNRLGRGHLWVCPWLRDNDTDPFDEWVVRLNQPVKLMAGVDYFVDIAHETGEVAMTPVGSMQWAFITKTAIDNITRPDENDYSNTETFWAPALPWLFNTDFFPPD